MFAMRKALARHAAAVVAVVFSLALPVGAGWVAPTAVAQEMSFFRIATGSISGVYYPVAGVISTAISRPPGARSCSEGGSCGVPGLVAVAQASRGSIQNVQWLAEGKVESAFVQADVAHDAITGRGAFAASGPVRGLRAIARMYTETLHIVVRDDSPIRTVADLKGKRVSLDLADSGTRAVANRVLAAYGLSPADLQQRNSQVGPALGRLEVGTLDAFFFVGGFPVPVLSTLGSAVQIRLLPVEAKTARRIAADNPFLASASVPAGAYGAKGPFETIAIEALWLVLSDVDAELVNGITRSLWHPLNRRLLDQGPPATRQIVLEKALEGVSVPLHPGAARYYREIGMIQPGEPRGDRERFSP